VPTEPGHFSDVQEPICTYYETKEGVARLSISLAQTPIQSPQGNGTPCNVTSAPAPQLWDARSVPGGCVVVPSAANANAPGPIAEVSIGRSYVVVLAGVPPGKKGVEARVEKAAYAIAKVIEDKAGTKVAGG
jgi:hypothetical protein